MSVIIPTYNRDDTIGRAVESALSQTLDDIEIIVIDDGSTDKTEQVVQSHLDDRINYMKHEENRGGSAARNTGIEASNGHFIAFLDSDDEWLPEKLELQVDLLNSLPPDWIASYCDFKQTRANRFIEIADNIFRRSTGTEGGDQLIDLIFQRKLAHGGASTLLIEQDVVRKIGGFDPTFERFQDLEFLVRLLRHGKLCFVNKTLVLKHDTGNPSRETAEKSFEKFCEKYSEEIERRSLTNRVEQIHHFMLAKYYFEDGDLYSGIKGVINGECPHYRDAFGLLFAIWKGIRNTKSGTDVPKNF